MLATTTADGWSAEKSTGPGPVPKRAVYPYDDCATLTRGQAQVSLREAEETVQAALALEWVSEAWGRDLAIVGGQFALDVSKATPSRTTLRTIGADFETLSSLTVTGG